jgi:hypothetical protein
MLPSSARRFWAASCFRSFATRDEEAATMCSGVGVMLRDCISSAAVGEM